MPGDAWRVARTAWRVFNNHSSAGRAAADAPGGACAASAAPLKGSDNKFEASVLLQKLVVLAIGARIFATVHESNVEKFEDLEGYLKMMHPVLPALEPLTGA